VSVFGGFGEETVVWKACSGTAGASRGLLSTAGATRGVVGVTNGTAGLNAVAKIPIADWLATGAIITGLVGAATRGVGAAMGVAGTPGAFIIGVKRELAWEGEVGRLNAELERNGGSAGDTGPGVPRSTGS